MRNSIGQQYLVYIEFIPGGCLSPDELFSRVNAKWNWVEEPQQVGNLGRPVKPLSALCIAEYESIEQLAFDLSIMPGAGISNVEISPVPVETETSIESFSGVAR